MGILPANAGAEMDDWWKSSTSIGLLPGVGEIRSEIGVIRGISGVGASSVDGEGAPEVVADLVIFRAVRGVLNVDCAVL